MKNTSKFVMFDYVLFAVIFGRVAVDFLFNFRF